MKKWYKSKTIWFNIGTGMVVLGGELMNVVGMLDVEWSDEARVAMAGVVAMGNIILRIITEARIER